MKFIFQGEGVTESKIQGHLSYIAFIYTVVTIIE
jgi:hypothetical protein